jgi:hypothetical protein
MRHGSQRLETSTQEKPMNDDPRCCGSGTCIIDAEGRCWCGQQWDGQKMCHAPLARTGNPAPTDAQEQPHAAERNDS